MNKKTYVFIIFISISIILAIFAVLLFNSRSSEYSKVSKTTINSSDSDVIQNIQVGNSVELISSTNSSNVVISPNANITFYKNYPNCGHTIKVKEPVSSNMVNLTQQEFANLYSDWSIDKFTSLDIELSKNFPDNCGEHYFVASKDGYVVIYNINTNGDLVFKEQTDIMTKYLSQNDVSELESGITVYGRNNLNAYLENFE